MKAIFQLLSLVGVTWCSASTIVVPPSPGNVVTRNPFGVAPGTNAIGMRYQQVYGAPAFSSLANGAWITAVTFGYKDPGQIGGIANACIDFSTTSRAVDGLSTVFSENVGGDNRTVLGPGDIEMIRDSLGSLNVTIVLDTPFLYNPANGNLLMDIRLNRGFSNIGSTLDRTFDAVTLANDQTSFVAADFVNSTTATYQFSSGLVTAFTYTTVPEPSSALLMLAGLFTAYVFFVRKKQPNRKE